MFLCIKGTWFIDDLLNRLNLSEKLIYKLERRGMFNFHCLKGLANRFFVLEIKRFGKQSYTDESKKTSLQSTSLHNLLYYYFFTTPITNLYTFNTHLQFNPNLCTSNSLRELFFWINIKEAIIRPYYLCRNVHCAP